MMACLIESMQMAANYLDHIEQKRLTSCCRLVLVQLGLRKQIVHILQI